MSNMSYCRFRNTLKDLDDCFDALSDDGSEELSEDEKTAKDGLIKMCTAISEQFDEDKDNE